MDYSTISSQWVLRHYHVHTLDSAPCCGLCMVLGVIGLAAAGPCVWSGGLHVVMGLAAGSWPNGAASHVGLSGTTAFSVLTRYSVMSRHRHIARWTLMKRVKWYKGDPITTAVQGKASPNILPAAPGRHKPSGFSTGGASSTASVALS